MEHCSFTERLNPSPPNRTRRTQNSEPRRLHDSTFIRGLLAEFLPDACQRGEGLPFLGMIHDVEGDL